MYSPWTLFHYENITKWVSMVSMLQFCGIRFVKESVSKQCFNHVDVILNVLNKKTITLSYYMHKVIKIWAFLLIGLCSVPFTYLIFFGWSHSGYLHAPLKHIDLGHHPMESGLRITKKIKPTCQFRIDGIDWLYANH